MTRRSLLKDIFTASFIAAVFAVSFIAVSRLEAAIPSCFYLKWGTGGNGNGQFSNPWNIAVDSSNNVYVTDQSNHRVQKFDQNGNYMSQWGGFGTGDGFFNAPQGIAIDSSNNVYVTELQNNRVQKFTSNGGFLLKWGGAGTGNSQFANPSGIAVDTSGNVYVADTGNNRIQKFDSNGGYLTQWGTIGSGNNQFQTPSGIAVDGSGYVYVSDDNNSRIIKFSNTGIYQTQWGQYSADPQFGFSDSIKVAVDNGGNVYVSDSYYNNIRAYSNTGAYLAVWGSTGTGDGQFNWPAGMAVNSYGDIYAADFNGNRIEKFSATCPSPTITPTATITPTLAPTAQGYMGNLAEVSFGDTFFFYLSTQKYDMPFTSPSTKTLTGMRYFTDTNGTPPSYIFSIQGDDGAGHPDGVNLGSGGVIQTPGYGWNTVSGLSAGLTAGHIYHIVVNYSSGTINMSNCAIFYWDVPDTHIMPLNQYYDPAAAASYFDGGIWNLSGAMPAFTVDFSDTTSMGNPYANSTFYEVYGGNYYAENFIAPVTASVNRLGVFIQGNGGSEDNLNFRVFNVTDSKTEMTGILFPAGQDYFDQIWVDADMPGYVNFQAGKNYRLEIYSPGTSEGASFSVVAATDNGAGAYYDNLTYNGSLAFLQSSSDSGTTWGAAIASDDMVFRFSFGIPPTATPFPTRTATPTATNTITQTVSMTITQTITQTVTQTATRTITQTITPTITQTVTKTVTQTATQTITMTMTQTVTQTVTQSVTKTNTTTSTPTPTISPTFTATQTFSVSPTLTATACVKLDTVFNGTGIVAVNGAAGGAGYDAARAVMTDTGDRVVITGYGANGSNSDMILFRYNPNGTLDTTFNGNGKRISDNIAGSTAAIAGRNDYGNAIAKDRNGKYVVAGQSNSTTYAEMAIWRYNSDGSVDTTFNSNGYVLAHGAAGGTSDDVGQAVAIDSQNRIISAGYSWNALGNIDMAVWRYNQDGSVDTTFNGTGHAVSTDIAGGPYTDMAYGVAIDSQDRVVIVGMSKNAAINYDMVIWRYKTDGTLDTTFNGTGYRIYAGAFGGDDILYAVMIDANGSIYTTGYETVANYTTKMVVMKLNNDGSFDNTFGGGTGIVKYSGASGGVADFGYSIMLDPNRRIMIGGDSSQGLSTGNLDMAIWRLNPDGTLDTTFNGTGYLTQNSAAGGNAADSALGIAMDSANRIITCGQSSNGTNDDAAVWRYTDGCSVFNTPTPTITASNSVTPTFSATKTFTSTYTVTPSPTQLCAGEFTFGQGTFNGGLWELGGSTLSATRYNLATAGTAMGMNVYFYQASGGLTALLAIYDNNPLLNGGLGGPGNIIVQSGQNVVIAGWNHFDITNTPLSPGIYWLAVQGDNGTIVDGFYTAGSNDLAYRNGYPINTFPAVFTPSFFDSLSLAINVDMCPAPTFTATPAVTITQTQTQSATPTNTATDSPTIPAAGLNLSQYKSVSLCAGCGGSITYTINYSLVPKPPASPLGAIYSAAATKLVGPGQAYTTISAALAAAVPGDVIEVVDSGVYEEYVNFPDTKNTAGIILRARPGQHPAIVAPDSVAGNDLIDISFNCTIAGFIVDGRFIADHGICQNTAYSGYKIDRCFVKNCISRGINMWVIGYSGAPTSTYPSTYITNCILANNNINGDGSGIYLQQGEVHAGMTVNIWNCTMYGNQYGIFVNGPAYPYDIRNCVMRGNINPYYGDKSKVSYSVIEESTAGYGTGCVNSDPIFANSAAGNFHLITGSPAIDTGDASVSSNVIYDMDFRPRPANGFFDMGAYEYEAINCADTANGINVWDTIPAALSLVTASSGFTTNGPVISWVISSLCENDFSGSRYFVAAPVAACPILTPVYFGNIAYANHPGDLTPVPANPEFVSLCVATPTNTASATQTFTQTVTQTATPTRTATPANTASVTQTATQTITQTQTKTYTATQTGTSTSTATPTFTNTPLNTATDTPTYTATRTGTPTYTATQTGTPTSTATPTLTNTPVNTATDTPTHTVTVTDSPTYTVTQTATPTFSITLTSSATSTPTQSYTLTLTATGSLTATKTGTPTFTVTPTHTSTFTATLTRTCTGTATFTATLPDTFTDTPTQTPTFTYTPTPLPTFTFTITMTWTITETFTSTPTPNENKVFDRNYVDVSKGETLKIKIKAAAIGEYVNIKVFNLSGEYIRKMQFMTYTPGWNDFEWDIKNGAGKIVGQGMYFVFIEYQGENTTKRVYIVK